MVVVTEEGDSPPPRSTTGLVSPNVADVPYSKWYVVSAPLGLIVPARFSDVVETGVAAPVITLGAALVWNVTSSP